MYICMYVCAYIDLEVEVKENTTLFFLPCDHALLLPYLDFQVQCTWERQIKRFCNLYACEKLFVEAPPPELRIGPTW